MCQEKQDAAGEWLQPRSSLCPRLQRVGDGLGRDRHLRRVAVETVGPGLGADGDLVHVGVRGDGEHPTVDEDASLVGRAVVVGEDLLTLAPGEPEVGGERGLHTLVVDLLVEDERDPVGADGDVHVHPGLGRLGEEDAVAEAGFVEVGLDVGERERLVGLLCCLPDLRRHGPVLLRADLGRAETHQVVAEPVERAVGPDLAHDPRERRRDPEDRTVETIVVEDVGTLGRRLAVDLGGFGDELADEAGDEVVGRHLAGEEVGHLVTEGGGDERGVDLDDRATLLGHHLGVGDPVAGPNDELPALEVLVSDPEETVGKVGRAADGIVGDPEVPVELVDELDPDHGEDVGIRLGHRGRGVEPVARDAADIGRILAERRRRRDDGRPRLAEENLERGGRDRPRLPVDLGGAGRPLDDPPLVAVVVGGPAADGSQEDEELPVLGEEQTHCNTLIGGKLIPKSEKRINKNSPFVNRPTYRAVLRNQRSEPLTHLFGHFVHGFEFRKNVADLPA